MNLLEKKKKWSGDSIWVRKLKVTLMVIMHLLCVRHQADIYF